MNRNFIVLAGIFLLATSGAFAQNATFISTSELYEMVPEARQVRMRLDSIVGVWEKEIFAYQKQIDDLDLEIRANKQAWSDAVRIKKNKDLSELEANLETYHKQKFWPGGEYDQILRQIMKPIEQKIVAAMYLRLFFPALFIGR